MSIFTRIKSVLGPSPSTTPDQWRIVIIPVGTAEPQCPHCGHWFEKLPQRKRSCPGCGGTFYSRKRPYDDQKVLLTDEQVSELEGQVALVALSQEGDPSGVSVDETFRQLGKSLDRAPRAEDVVQAHLDAISRKHEDAWRWGLFRNARFGRAESHARQGNYVDAARLFLEVCLLDLNGPRNMGSRDPDILKRFPPFDPKQSFLAPGVLSRLEDSAAKAGLSVEDLQRLFQEVASAVGPRVGLPRPHDDSWDELAKELKSRK